MTAVSAPARIDELNALYEQKHKAFEDNFWATKMALKSASTEELAKTKTDYENFLGDAETLKEVRELLKDPNLTVDQRRTLEIMEKTFKCYITEGDKIKALKEDLISKESALSAKRNALTTGYTDPATGEFKKASSVGLRNQLRVADDEATRKACYEGMRAIGPFLAENNFLEIVKMRNVLARSMGYEDFYDYKVTSSEGFSKRRLFEIMDGLEKQSRPIMEAARQRLAKEKGEDALKAWNISYSLAGESDKLLDPYFPFEEAVDVWARTFAALGINYRNSTMRLDLCDREGKYSNGFCHWPQVAWVKPDGSFQPAQANFTSLATPNQVGSGKTALETLLHEGGHAAHFANVAQPSPFFSQERAPMSVAYAENQSMFLDSYAKDAAWLGRYARNRSGEIIPWEVIAEEIKSVRPYDVFMLRSMLAVPYFEKALYELPEDQLTNENLLALADRVEMEIQGGLSPRPLLSVPHPLNDESSCYYHGYVLAEMSVHQTRQHFIKKYGYLVDNPDIGRDLTEVYWLPGNGEAFLTLVERLTGEPLSAEAWVGELKKPVEAMLAEERSDYDEAVKTGPRFKPGEAVDIGMRVILVHGDEVIGDSELDGGLTGACAKFKSWVDKHYFSGVGKQA